MERKTGDTLSRGCGGIKFFNEDSIEFTVKRKLDLFDLVIGLTLIFLGLASMVYAMYFLGFFSLCSGIIFCSWNIFNAFKYCRH